MWAYYMKYRALYGIDTIMTQPADERAARLREVYPTGYCGVAKNGWPIYIERNGYINVDEVNKLFPEEPNDNEAPPMLRIFARSYEDL